MEIMRENIKLIKQIGSLRKEVKQLTSDVKKEDPKTKGMSDSLRDLRGQDQGPNFNQSRESFDDNALDKKHYNIAREYIETQREKLQLLREENKMLKRKIGMAGAGGQEF